MEEPRLPRAHVTPGGRGLRLLYILFLDGDTILNPDFPASAIKVLESEPAIAAVWGHRRELHPERSLYNRVLDLDWIYAAGDTDYCGGDVLMRRSALAEAEGYDSRLDCRGGAGALSPSARARLSHRAYRLPDDRPRSEYDAFQSILAPCRPCRPCLC